VLQGPRNAELKNQGKNDLLRAYSEKKSKPIPVKARCVGASAVPTGNWLGNFSLMQNNRKLHSSIFLHKKRKTSYISRPWQGHLFHYQECNANIITQKKSTRLTQNPPYFHS
jgi:hypothetical protein